MKVATIDLETFWSQDHSLSKMSPLVYCMHPETELICMSVKVDNYPTDVFFGESEIRKAIAGMRGFTDYMVLGHNMSGFDSMILAWRLGVRPKMWGCTLAMARPIHAKDVGLSLAKLVEHYNLGRKNNAALINTRGKKLKDFTSDELSQMEKYNKDDANQCYDLFRTLLPHFSAAEMWQIDASIRMLVEPKFEADVGLLRATLDEERASKRANQLRLARKLIRAGLAPEDMLVVADIDELLVHTQAVLQSSAKFSELLALLGVEAPMKPSPKDPERLIPALAKTDDGMHALRAHENELVAAAADARLEAKSTLLETRLEKFLEAAAATGGLLPIPIHVYGADTTGRWSGWSYNPQNLPRVPRDRQGNVIPKRTNALRMALRASKGHSVIVADLSGIELRVNLTLWKVKYAMDLLKQDPQADLYKPLASEVLGVPMEDMPKMVRQAGKAMHLGCGFGLRNTQKYQVVARTMAGIEVSEVDADRHILGYRAKHPEVVGGWKTCHGALRWIYDGDEYAIDPWGLCHTSKHGIHLPSGRVIRYPGLRVERGERGDEWWYGHGRHVARIYAGKVDENCLSGDTIVLTNNGWKQLTSVSMSDRLWDGENWVPHQGVVCNGVRHTLDFGGLYLTPDHGVYTDGRWRAAVDTEPWQAAQTYQRSFRLPHGHAARHRGGWLRRAADALARAVRLRRGSNVAVRRADQGQQVLRVFQVPPDRAGCQNAWALQAPGVPSVELHAAAVHTAVAPRVEELWRQGRDCLRAVGGFVRRVLVGHGVFLGAWAGAGSARQRRSLLARELPMGDAQAERPQQKEPPRGSNAARSDAGMGGSRSVRREQDHTAVPGERGVAGGAHVRQAGRDESVYDIVNAGPNHRFTVALGDGRPVLVHNCVQALARDVLADASVEFFKRTGLRYQLTVHDELVYVVQTELAEGLLDTLQQIMRTPPRWWPELITWSEGDIAATYGDAK